MSRMQVLEMLHELDHKVELVVRERAQLLELYKKADEERKRLDETVKCQQETIRILQEHIKRSTEPKLDIKSPPISFSKELEEGDGAHE